MLLPPCVYLWPRYLFGWWPGVHVCTIPTWVVTDPLIPLFFCSIYLGSASVWVHRYWVGYIGSVRWVSVDGGGFPVGVVFSVKSVMVRAKKRTGARMTTTLSPRTSGFSPDDGGGWWMLGDKVPSSVVND
ncbi:hypothetical protein GGR51DRAFT_56635 [Nemania sp. FL0031]|nr:hypothetical protein GGR51DRAFT_56635 [Nemania sp. FL0031]